MKFWTLVLALVLLAPLQVRAQDAQKPLQVGVGMLGASYTGDLTTRGGALNRFHPGMNFSLQFVSEKLLSPQLNTGFGKFVGQDRLLAATDGVQPNTFVQTSFFFVDFRLKARFLRNFFLHPYLSAGIGLFGYTPKDEDGSPLVDIFATRADGELYGSITAAFPLTAGLEIPLSHLIGVNVEYTFRPTGTDYLDNIGQLGPKSGNDQVHSLVLGILVTFDPNRGIGASFRSKDWD